MIPISGLGNIKTASETSKRKGVSQAGNFAALLAAAEEGVPAASQTTDIAATAALSNLLALQEISEEDVNRKKLTQQGNNLLDSLEGLRRQLLMGTLPEHVLINLARELALKKQTVNDPALMELMDDIELRAAVEIAKLQVALKNAEENGDN